MRIPNIPRSFASDQQMFIRGFYLSLFNSIETKLSKVEANDSILLTSPGGKIYSVSVDDSGNLTTTLVQG